MGTLPTPSLDDFDSVFGILSLRQKERSELPASLEAWVAERVVQREAARSQRDWEQADAIRDELEEHGIVLEDSPNGTRWRVRGAPGDDSAAVPQHVDG